MIPTLLQLGPIPIHSFGLMMVLAFLAAWRCLALVVKHAGHDAKHAEQMIFWSAVGGIVGARVMFILSYFQNFLDDPLGMIFSGAGFVYYGGFIGGVFASWLYTRKEKLHFFEFADYAAPALAIGYAVGRVGCQLSGDGDYGHATTLPWAMSYSLGVVPTEPGVLVHPAPIYETCAAFFIAYFLLRLLDAKRLRASGQLAALFLILTAIERFAVEIIRIEPRVFAGLTQAQLISILLVFFGSLLFVLRKKATAA